MRSIAVSVVVLATLGVTSVAAWAKGDLGAIRTIAIEAGAPAGHVLKLRGADAKQQLLVSGAYDNDLVRDLTRQVTYSASPAGVVSISKGGVVTPIADGPATITATSNDGQSASHPVIVEQASSPLPINFPNKVVPIFTKAGCNAGGCHGKSGGQNGFKLSLLGFEPGEDYEHLVKEARGRRLFPAAPDRSLLLLKSIGTMPHGGGKRIDADSDDYRILHRWIAQGMPYGKAGDPTVSRIEVLPGRRVMRSGGEQQLVVMAHYTDGSVEDVTRSALYEPNDAEMARVDEGGRVQVLGRPGDVAVMVRYQAKVAVYRATVPLGIMVADSQLPPARNFIDEHVLRKLKDVGLPPSPVSDDATFLRRVTVDVAGRLPTPREAEAFLASREPDKRDKWIDTLLDTPDYADYFANKWTALLRNKRTRPADARNTYAFHGWVRDSFITNKPYDQFVREILTASGDVETNPAVAWYRQVKDPGAQLEDTAQLFLGMRLQCAQCHHHPFEKWSQQDYYGFAAFFSRVGRKGSATAGDEAVFHRRGQALANNPKTKQPVKPSGLGDGALTVSTEDDPRQVLAEWMTRKENPFFARSLANRYWKHFFGRGLVDPEDDMRETNPPTNPELLDALAKHFADSGFDTRELIRTICRSTTYQLASMPNEHNRVDRQNFSRYYPRRMNAEVLLDAVNAVTGAESKFEGLPSGTRAIQLPDNFFNTTSYFLTVFGRPDASSSCECERSGDPSLAQSLHLLNAKEIQEKLSAPGGRAAKLAADEKRSDEEKVRELYRLAFSREPDTEELAAARAYVQKIAARDDGAKEKEKKELAARRKQAYEDLIWALINTKEFAFNH